MADTLPVVDMTRLLDRSDTAGRRAVGDAVARACDTYGFFYLTGHGVTLNVLAELEEQSRAFFALPLAEKMTIAMAHGGRAWRGYFPVGGELTSGKPDLKEGLYLGVDLPTDDPRVVAGLPMHGANLWPETPPGLRAAVDAYMQANSFADDAFVRDVESGIYFDPARMHVPQGKAPVGAWSAEHRQARSWMARDHPGRRFGKPAGSSPRRRRKWCSPPAAGWRRPRRSTPT